VKCAPARLSAGRRALPLARYAWANRRSALIRSARPSILPVI